MLICVCSPQCECIDGCNLLSENTTGGYICELLPFRTRSEACKSDLNFRILHAISHVFTEVATLETVTSLFTGIPRWFFLFNILFTAD